VSALNLAGGPAMYLGGSIMTFALPYGAFIVIASVLFFVYRRPHSGPRLKYLASPSVTSVLTREPGPVPAPVARAEEDPRPGTADTNAAAGTGPNAAAGTGPNATEGTE
jgi:hypothetical protein